MSILTISPSFNIDKNNSIDKIDKMSQNKKWRNCPRCGRKTLVEKQFCRHCLYNIGLDDSLYSFNIGYKPGWVGAFNSVNPHPEAMDAEGERNAMEVMLGERKKEMKMSSKAARWERERKVAWNRNVKYKKAGERKHRKELEQAKKTAVEFLSSRAKKNIKEKSK